MSSISGSFPAIPPRPDGAEDDLRASGTRPPAEPARTERGGTAARPDVAARAQAAGAAAGPDLAAGPVGATRPRSAVGIDTSGWSVNGYVWYPFFDDKPPLAFAKYDQIFGGTSAEAAGHAFFEGYASVEKPLARGTWVPAAGAGRPGYVQESNFEVTSGVDVTGDRAISDAMYRLLRRSGAPQDAKFALRDAAGRELPTHPGDRLAPSFVEGGEVREAEARSEGGDPAYYKPGTQQKVAAPIAWRVQGADGKIRGSAQDKLETRADLVGLAPGTRFDFLDASREPVDFHPRKDRIVQTFEEGGHWHAIVPLKDGLEHETLDAAGEKVLARAAIGAAEADRLLRAHARDSMYRVQDRATGRLKGDGKVGEYFDLYWWGKAHNTAAIDSSGLPQPKKDVKVAVGLAPGEELGVRVNGAHVAKPARDEAGRVTGWQGSPHSGDVVARGPAPAAGAAAELVVVAPGGAVKPARLVTVSAEEVQTLVAHIGADAIESKAAIGARFHGVPDEVRLKSGKALGDVRILSAALDSGKKVEVQRETDGEWRDVTRGLFRGADLKNARVGRGYRDVAWSDSSMAAVNDARADKIRSIEVRHADGAEETIAAADIDRVGQESPFDLSPQDLWDAAARVKDGKSLTIEKASGPQVWSYAVKEMATERIDRSAVPAAALAAEDLAGARAGGALKDGRLYFRTSVKYLENGEAQEKAYHYWAKMGKDGEIADYNFLVDPEDPDSRTSAAPDFFWQKHVKDPIEGRWDGESEVPGASMRNIQALYNAATGALDAYAVGGALTVEDLETRKPIK